VARVVVVVVVLWPSSPSSSLSLSKSCGRRRRRCRRRRRRRRRRLSRHLYVTLFEVHETHAACDTQANVTHKHTHGPSVHTLRKRVVACGMRARERVR
jgi:hypothetical protein